MADQNLRWVQRLSNYGMALQQLSNAVEKPLGSDQDN